MNDDTMEFEDNFRSVDEVEPERFEWGARKFLVNAATVRDAKMTLAVVWIAPGKEEPLHSHPNCEQLVHVLDGECEFELGDTLYHLDAGDTVRIPAGVTHQALNSGWEPVRLLATFNVGAVVTNPVKAGTQ